MVGKRSCWHQVDELIGGKVLFNFAQVSNTVGKHLCSLARNVSRTWNSGDASGLVSLDDVLNTPTVARSTGLAH